MDRFKIATDKYPIEKEFSETFSGIDRKIEGKTRIKKKFILIKKLNGKWKFLDIAYVLQKCLKTVYTGLSEQFSAESLIESGNYWLSWDDMEWVDRQTLFLNCKSCNNELIGSGSYLSSDTNGDEVTYKCTDCGRVSKWNFNIIPGAVEV